MEIALVRGPYLRPNGILPWVALDARYPDMNVTAFESDPPRFDTSSLPIPVEQLSWLDGKIDAFGYDHFIDRGLAHLNLPHSILLGMSKLANRYDVIHTSENFTVFSAQAAVAAKGTDTEFVFSAGENIPFFPGNSFTWQIKKLVNREASGMTTTTQLGKRALIHEGVAPEKVSVLPNALELEKFDTGPKTTASLDLPTELEETFNILFVHKLCEQKGIRYLIDAFDELHENHDDMRLLLVGSNEFDEDFYQTRINQHKAIYHIEYIENERIDKLYNLSDIFTLPSITVRNNQEQFGMALLEAMACGVPSIITNVGGLPFVAAAGETSLVVNERSSEEIAAAIRQLYANPELRTRLGERSYSYVRENYHKNVLADKLYAFYENL